jgi:hypothetical protein
VDDFIDSKDDIFDEATAKKMVYEGTKLVVLEGLYGHCGISAVFWLSPSWVRLSYQDFPIFLELLLQDPEYDPVKTAMEELADWFERCYELMTPRKRSRHPKISSISNHETLKRRNAQPLKSAKPLKARRLTIQHNNFPAISDGATQDNRHQEATRPKGMYFPINNGCMC